MFQVTPDYGTCNVRKWKSEVQFTEFWLMKGCTLLLLILDIIYFTTDHNELSHNSGVLVFYPVVRYKGELIIQPAYYCVMSMSLVAYETRFIHYHHYVLCHNARYYVREVSLLSHPKVSEWISDTPMIASSISSKLALTTADGLL